MIRVGFGKDVHKFVEGQPFILGGATIPFEKGLIGHSDADVLTHAVIDALLGAAAFGDIGTHFPDTDMEFKDVSSVVLLKEAYNLIAAQHWNIQNIDCVVTLQKPKIAEYIPLMRENISRVLHLDIAAVSIKATTSEGLGYEGSGEGVTADVVVLIAKHENTSR